MQILHPCTGSIQEYLQEIWDANRYRPGRCPQCDAKHPLTAHGFYSRTLVDVAFDGSIRVRRYLCHLCQRTVSLLPAFALPYLRFSLAVIGSFLVARLQKGLTLKASATGSAQPDMPYQRAQFWLRRFRKQAESLCAALASLTAPPPALNFMERALDMLQSVGWMAAHRFLLDKLRMHLLGWPAFLVPNGLRARVAAVPPPA